MDVVAGSFVIALLPQERGRPLLGKGEDSFVVIGSGGSLGL